jgi:hypothetical protein
MKINNTDANKYFFKNLFLYFTHAILEDININKLVKEINNSISNLNLILLLEQLNNRNKNRLLILIVFKFFVHGLDLDWTYFNTSRIIQ